MKISQICALTLLLAVASVMAFADPINDPKIIVGGAGGGGGGLIAGKCDKCIGVGSNFSFTVPASGSGNLFFTNESGKNWSSLSFIEKGVPAADITCSTYLFSSCTTKTLKNGSVEILLSGTAGGVLWKDHGIPNGDSFEISLTCKGGCWPAGMTFRAHGSGRMTMTPEPGTIGLMITGLSALVVSRRKTWKNRWNS